MLWPNLSPAHAPTPMLFENAASLPVGGEWDYEYSWAGERVLVTKNGTSVKIASAGHRRDLTNRFPVIAAMIARLPLGAVVLDGVIRPIEPPQAPLLGTTVDAAASAAAQLRLIATDILWWEELDTRQLPLAMRKQRLAEAIGGSGVLIAAAVDTPLRDMLEEAKKVGADGVIAKRRDSRYRPFAHTGDWVRVAVDTGAARAAIKAALAPNGRLASDRGNPFRSGWWQAAT